MARQTFEGDLDSYCTEYYQALLIFSDLFVDHVILLMIILGDLHNSINGDFVI